MGKVIRNRGDHLSSRHSRSAPYPTPSVDRGDVSGKGGGNGKDLSPERRNWKQATCAVCLEFPHNAVLLLCSSHDKGCRPYMCGTGRRLSNCLEQFKNANSPVSSSHELGLGLENAEHAWPEWKEPKAIDLKCPLCRGQVKGWTVAEPARRYLDRKKRSCMHGDCSFLGNYKQLRKHVKVEHHSARPHTVDPVLEQKWKMLENQREQQDIFSTIRSSMPGAIILGDYVIDMTDHSDSDSDSDDTDSISSYDRASRRRRRRNNRRNLDFRRGSGHRRHGLRLTHSGRGAGTRNGGNAGRASANASGTASTATS